jgi:hypothetical protein
MVNAQGVVTSRFFEQAYQEGSTVGRILARLGNDVAAGDEGVVAPTRDRVVRQGVCFIPQSVRLTWTVTLRQLDRDRAKP